VAASPSDQLGRHSLAEARDGKHCIGIDVRSRFDTKRCQGRGFSRTNTGDLGPPDRKMIEKGVALA
jgi:hypothetical protein